MIQGCPVEVLDNIFECMAYSDPENAQANLCSLMLTCSYFGKIAKRHFIRIVCLPNAEKVNAFAGHLMQLVEGGEYGNRVLPIQHLAVAGTYRIHRAPSDPRRSDAEGEAERVVPFIITTAAPSLLTLAIFGVNASRGTGWTSDGEESCVPDGTAFPRLRDLIALEQGVIALVLWDGKGEPDKQACQLRHPSLRRLYIHHDGYDSGGSLPLTLPYLDDLRLEMLNEGYSKPILREEVVHVRSLIIDAPRYSLFTMDGSSMYRQSRDEYARKISIYQTLIDEVGNSERNGIVVPIAGFTHETNRGRILSGWADAVIGGEGCWTTAWIPTIPYTGRYED